MTGKITKNIQCSSCRQYFPESDIPLSGERKCKECMKKYKREWTRKNKHKLRLKQSEEYRHCENFGSAGLYC